MFRAGRNLIRVPLNEVKSALPQPQIPKGQQSITSAAGSNTLTAVLSEQRGASETMPSSASFHDLWHV